MSPPIAGSRTPQYTPAQLDAYFARIKFPRAEHPTDRLALLTALQRHQVTTVPFESLSLHYSKHRRLSLDPADLFAKIVTRGHGGYCMEVNTFFACVLRALGFTLMHAGARVRDGAWLGLSHMVNIVTIGDTDGKDTAARYLVDVGFGSNGACQPIPLSEDPARVWVYETALPGPAAEFEAQYSVVDAEFFPEDFEIMNLATSTLPTGLFVKTVLATLQVAGGDGEVEGVVILLKDTIKRRIGDAKTEVLETLKSEDDRVKALEKYYGVVLTDEERRGIRGLASEITDAPY
ncbi:Carnosine synthase 1 [Verticillium dahliae VDG2]|nr:Carnosine synthase 1 [Verticillium dahliae VDG2]